MSISFDHFDITHPLLEVRSCFAGRGWFASQCISAGVVLFSRFPLQTGDSLEDVASKIDSSSPPYNALCRPEGAKSAPIGIAERNCFRSVSGRWLLYGPEISFINHACCPSVSVVWGPRDCAHVVVIHDLLPGDEVTFCYSQSLLFSPRVKRCRELTERWGFTCCCERCTGPMDASEASMWELMETCHSEVAANTPRRLAIHDGLVDLLKCTLQALCHHRPWLCESLDLHDALLYFAEDWAHADDGGPNRPSLASFADANEHWSKVRRFYTLLSSYTPTG
eukprot:GGOE01045181.1.p1 GENE.GGOE01045181.1~~GGOE01045181.1.p1  ORF type:complete len:280 (+),score=11.02 GGOE01045181.1:32-871(+)